MDVSVPSSWLMICSFLAEEYSDICRPLLQTLPLAAFLLISSYLQNFVLLLNGSVWLHRVSFKTNDLDTIQMFYECRVESSWGVGQGLGRTRLYFPAQLIHSSWWHRPCWDVISQESVQSMCTWCRRESLCQWKHKLCWGWSVDKTLKRSTLYRCEDFLLLPRE